MVDDDPVDATRPERWFDCSLPGSTSSRSPSTPGPPKDPVVERDPGLALVEHAGVRDVVHASDFDAEHPLGRDDLEVGAGAPRSTRPPTMPNACRCRRRTARLRLVRDVASRARPNSSRRGRHRLPVPGVVAGPLFATITTSGSQRFDELGIAERVVPELDAEPLASR